MFREAFLNHDDMTALIGLHRTVQNHTELLGTQWVERADLGHINAVTLIKLALLALVTLRPAPLSRLFSATMTRGGQRIAEREIARRRELREDRS